MALRFFVLLWLVQLSNEASALMADEDPDLNNGNKIPEVHETEDGPSPINNDKAIEEEIKLVAKTYKWQFDETKKFMAQQEAFSELVGDLEENYGDQFADAEMAENPGEKAKIYIKGGEASLVKGGEPSLAKGDSSEEMFETKFKDFKRKSHIDVEVIKTQYSLKEQEDRAERLFDAMEKQGFTNIGYSLGPGDALTIGGVPPLDSKGASPFEITPESKESEFDFKAADPVAQQVFLKSDKISNSDLYGVRVIIDDEEKEVDFHTRGGRRIYRSGSSCTTGFTVRGPGGVTGVATAGHCTGMNRYDAEPPENDYSTLFQRQHNGYWGDYEWHTTPHIEPPEYWASPTQRRRVTSVMISFYRGQVVCGYSRRRGLRFCDRIYRTRTRQGSNRRLIAMRRMNMRPGDSGGPWSWGTSAAGFVKGAKRIWFRWRDTWSRASYLPYAIPNVVVRT